MPLRDHIRRWWHTIRSWRTRRRVYAFTFTLTDQQQAELRRIYASRYPPFARGGIVRGSVTGPRYHYAIGRDGTVWDLIGATAVPLDDTPSVDALPRDPRPEYCWRCDALPATNPIIGLCATCHTDLTTKGD